MSCLNCFHSLVLFSPLIKSGAYGIGILDLIEAQNWKDEQDFAKCYINWGGYAYSGSSPEGIEAKTEFTHRLSTVEVAIHNQDDREHDIFDSE